MKREGTLHIVWRNKGQDGVEPIYSVGFADYQSTGGAMRVREFTGEKNLAQFLTEDIKVPQATVTSTFQGLRREGNANILNVVLSDQELGRLGFFGKDDPGFQRERIRRIGAEEFSNCEVVFDSSKPFSWIKFRIDDKASGRILGVSGDYHASEIADWSDEHLRGYLRHIAPYFARRTT